MGSYPATVKLPHAWIVRADGTVLDPTWDDAPGRAYIGIPLANSRLRPVDGGGLLQDFDRTLPLLREDIPRSALGDPGCPLTAEGHSWSTTTGNAWWGRAVSFWMDAGSDVTRQTRRGPDLSAAARARPRRYGHQVI